MSDQTLGHRGASAAIPGGWYADPGADGQQRYWDGAAWTSRVRPIAPACGSPGRRVFDLWAVLPVGTPAGFPLWPVPSQFEDSVELTEREHRAGNGVACRPQSVGLYVHAQGRPERVSLLTDIHPSMLITDERVALACSKFDKGSMAVPLGGLASGAVALAVTAASKHQAKKRRAGKMLVGHVRYEWLVSVGYFERTSAFLSRSYLRLGFMDPLQPTRGLMLNVGIPGHLSPRQGAEEILRRATAHQLGNRTGLSTGERHRLIHLDDHEAPPAGGHRLTTWFLRELSDPFRAALVQIV